jgi:hypothetical protein
MLLTGRRWGLALAGCLWAEPAFSQVAAPDRQVYPAAYFAEFSPQTALDIATHTPGFVLVSGDEVRGFGGAAGNVLIDGARPSSKSGGIEDVLRRIPAAQVERVEVIQGASTSEAQGQDLVLNIVRSGVTSGAWSVQIERNGSGLVYPRGEATLTRTIGPWETSVKVNGLWEQFPYRTLRLNRDAAGTLTSSFVEDRPSTLTEGFVSGDARRGLWGGTLNLTARLGYSYFHYDLDSDIFLGRLPSGLPDQTNLFELDSTEATVEIGGDFSRRFGDWTWKAVALATIQDNGVDQVDTRRGSNAARLSRSLVVLDQQPLELVGRTTLSRIAEGSLRSEFGAEVAYNRLHSAFSFALDDGTGPRPVEVPAANVQIDELRAEAFGNLNWAVTPDLTIETSLAVETSEITVTGDAGNVQRFTFLKPAAAVVWRVDPRTQLRLGVRRTVGQLDFGDFAASAELQDGETTAGNPALGPDQMTRLSVGINHRRSEDFALNGEIFHEWREDVLEQVRLPSGSPGLANAGGARVWGFKGSLNAPLDIFLAGAKLKVEAEIRASAFDDPLIAQVRELTDLRSPAVTAEFRHDPPGRPWSWGLRYDLGSDATTYLIDQTDFNESGARIGGFVETTQWLGLRARLAVSSAATERYRRFRRFFDPDRSGVLVGTDERFSARGAFVTLTLSGPF